MNRLLFVLLFIGYRSVASYAQTQTDICENSVPADWNIVNGRLSMTSNHFKLGKQSVQWDWTAGKSLLKVQNAAFKSVSVNPRSTFVVWIYNEKPVNDKLVFKFENVRENNRLSGIKSYTQLMLQVAQAYHGSTTTIDQQRLASIFMDLLDQLEDQGWAYGIGGYTGIAPILYALSGTSFKVAPDAHESLRNSLLMIHYYTNPFKWPLSVSGRHPTGAGRIPDVPYAYMAMAGTPDGNLKMDTLMASIYLKLSGSKKNKWTAAFKDGQIKPVGYASGHWNLNYGLLDVHRRQDWLLTLRGHNRYFISHVSYPGANMYGRYLSYGQLEVLFPEKKADADSNTAEGSNFKDEGWDWNNIPGTTTLHLPLDKLRANIINADDDSGIEEMLISDERFAGGTTFKKQGMFAMKLHGHDKYDMGSLRAVKSWVMFDDLEATLQPEGNTLLSVKCADGIASKIELFKRN